MRKFCQRGRGKVSSDFWRGLALGLACLGTLFVALSVLLRRCRRRLHDGCVDLLWRRLTSAAAHPLRARRISAEAAHTRTRAAAPSRAGSQALPDLFLLVGYCRGTYVPQAAGHT